jgi:ankyrin repeat protein
MGNVINKSNTEHVSIFIRIHGDHVLLSYYNKLFFKALDDNLVNIDAVSSDGQTLLNFICKRPYLFHCIPALLEKKANPNVLNDLGVSPLMNILATANETHDLIKLLVEAKANVNHKSRDQNQTPLMKAAEFGSLETVNYLIKCGADVHAKDYIGNTPLTWSFSNPNYVEIIGLLLEAKADINERVGQHTLLTFAVDNDNYGSAIMLLKLGADPLKLTLDGKNIMYYADAEFCSALVQEFPIITGEVKIGSNLYKGELLCGMPWGNGEIITSKGVIIESGRFKIKLLRGIKSKRNSDGTFHTTDAKGKVIHNKENYAGLEDKLIVLTQMVTDLQNEVIQLKQNAGKKR